MLVESSQSSNSYSVLASSNENILPEVDRSGEYAEQLRQLIRSKSNLRVLDIFHPDLESILIQRRHGENRYRELLRRRFRADHQQMDVNNGRRTDDDDDVGCQFPKNHYNNKGQSKTIGHNTYERS